MGWLDYPAKEWPAVLMLDSDITTSWLLVVNPLAIDNL